jgi:flagellar biosynthesis/type III secretory pathway M-ring protein FliF/YscJ
MGLKSGSRDAGLDESEEGDEQAATEESTETADASDRKRSAQESVGGAPEKSEAADSEREPETTADRPPMSSIPYKLRRDKVNEGREQVPYFLREEIIEDEDELQETLEELLGENVYKSDYREAAMVVAQRNPELVAEVLREWGYDLEAT